MPNSACSKVLQQAGRTSSPSRSSVARRDLASRSNTLSTTVRESIGSERRPMSPVVPPAKAVRVRKNDPVPRPSEPFAGRHSPFSSRTQRQVTGLTAVLRIVGRTGESSGLGKEVAANWESLPPCPWCPWALWVGLYFLCSDYILKKKSLLWVKRIIYKGIDFEYQTCIDI